MGFYNNGSIQDGKVALYCRVASGSSVDTDLIYTQRDELRAFAKDHGLAVGEEYLDNGYHGHTLNRPAFAQMEADIDAGNIDTIVVRGIDRVARDFKLAGDWVKRLQKLGVKLIEYDGSHEPPSYLSDLFECLNRPQELTVQGAQLTSR